MREYLRAFALADPSIRDYRDHFRLTLSALEVWPEVLPADRQIIETFLSFRHLEAATELREQYAQELEYLASGFKPRLENLSIIPGSVRQVSINGKPALVVWRYRIICADIGSVRDYPLSQLVELQDRAYWRWHWNRTGAWNYWHTDRSARYRIKPELAADYTDGVRFGSRLLDSLMANLPGLSGPGASITESHTSDDPSQPAAMVPVYARGTAANLNAAYYNREFSYPNGASNRSVALRGYNDPTLFVARTDRPEVHGITSGAQTYRYSYAVPLELLVRTPLESWNPYNMPIVADEANVSGSGTEANPYLEARASSRWYLTPNALFSGGDASNPDPADTGAGAVYMRDTGGTVRAVRASGMYVHLPPIAGIADDIRLRYPVFDLYHEGSPVWGMAQAAFGDIARANFAQLRQLATAATTLDDYAQRLRAIEHKLKTLYPGAE
jgi:hypothetical protein